jgi:hypothetical protein
MLEAITWKTYLTVIIIAVCIYYLFIALVYYRSNIQKIIQGKGLNQAAEEEDNGGFDELENVVEDIRHSILEEAGENASKAELLTQFRDRLANYGGLRQPAFRVALTNYLIQKSESICGVSFSREELEKEWDMLTRTGK